MVILQWRTAMHAMCACGTELSSCSLLSAVGPGPAEPRARAESWVVPVQAALHATQQSIFHALFQVAFFTRNQILVLLSNFFLLFLFCFVLNVAKIQLTFGDILEFFTVKITQMTNQPIIDTIG